jgi:dipeptidyl aminopeptidase/acylaminoacyl peptidase
MRHREIAERVIGNLMSAGSPAVSPDGRRVAFAVHRVDLADNTYQSQVWLMATDGATPPQPLTSGTSDGQPRWSPDGRWLAFTARRSEKEGHTTLHLLPVDQPGELRTVATMPDGIADVAFSPDGSLLAFTSRTRDARYEAKDESWQAPRKIEGFFSRLDDEGWIVDRPSHVYVVRADGSSAPRNLTPGPSEHHGVSWLADGSGVVTAAQRHADWDLDFAQDLYRVGLDGTVSALTAQTGLYLMPSVSPSGDQVAFLGYDDPAEMPQNAAIGVVGLDGAPHRFVSRALDRTFETTAGFSPPVWEADGSLLATAEDRGQTHLYRVHTDGRAPERLTDGAITVSDIDASAGTIVATIGSVDSVTDLFLVGPDGLRRLTSFAARYIEAAHPLSWERLAVPTTDGTAEIDAWVMRPAGFDPAQRYPVLLNVHGGPHTQYGETALRRGAVPGGGRVRRGDVQPARVVGPRADLGPGDHGTQAPHRAGHGLGQRRRRRRARGARCRARTAIRSATRSASACSVAATAGSWPPGSPGGTAIASGPSAANEPSTTC